MWKSFYWEVIALSAATVGIAALDSAAKHVLNINNAAKDRITVATLRNINACDCAVLDKDLLREYPGGMNLNVYVPILKYVQHK